MARSTSRRSYLAVIALTLLFAVGALAQSPVTVTGTVQAPNGALATSGYVQFDLQPASTGVLYYVSGTTVLAPQSAQCGINTSGQIEDLALTGACTVWGNDVITPGNTAYQVTFAPNNTVASIVSNVLITGSTYNLNTPVFSNNVKIVPQYQTITTEPIYVNLLPSANNVYDVGKNGLQYAAGYFGNLFLNGTLLNPADIPSTLPVPLSEGGCAGTNAVTCLSNINGAGKPAASDGVQFVSPNGNDSNDGLSWGTAKLTIAAALSTLSTAGVGGNVYAACGNYTITAEITVPTKTRLIGCGRGDLTWAAGTTITAGSGFPSGTPLIALGASSSAYAVRVENLTVNCNSIAGSIGVYNTNAEEESGAYHVIAGNCMAYDFEVTGSGAQNSGLYDIEALGSNSSTIGIYVASSVTAFRGVHGATVNGSFARGAEFDAAGRYADIHTEGATVGVYVDGDNIVLNNIFGGATDTTVVELASGLQSVWAQDISLNGATNVLKDDGNSNTLTSSFLMLYSIGIGTTPPVMYFSGGEWNYNGNPLAALGANGISSGTITLASGAGSHTFTTAYSAAPVCTFSDTTTSTNAVTPTVSATAISIAGTGTDVINWVCTPAAN